MREHPAIGSTVLVAALLALTSLAWADAPPKTPKLPEPLTPESIRELVARLSDADVRQLLIAQLDRAASHPAAGTPTPGDGMMGMVGGMEGRSQQLRAGMGALAEGTVSLPGALLDARARFLEGRGPGHLLLILVAFAAMLAVGILAERLVRLATAGLRRSLDEPSAEGGLLAQAAGLVLRLVLDIVELLAFAVGALGVFLVLYQGHQPSRQLVLTYLAAVVLVRLVALLSRFLLDPARPDRRLLPFDDAAASRLHWAVVWLAGFYAFGVGTVELLRSLGVPEPSLTVLSVVLSTAFLALALDTIWRVRGAVAGLILGPGDPGAGRRLAARAWPFLAAAYLVIVYLARALELLGGAAGGMSRAPILSVLILIVLPLLDMTLCRILTGLLPGSRESRATFEPVLRRAIHVVVVVTGLLLLADLWQLDLFALAERGLGGRIAGALLGIAIPLLLAWMLWELARTAIDHRIRTESAGGGAEPGEEGGQAASRLRTLLPLLRMTILGTLLLITTLSILAALGINILPLLAGASVLGLAIGFGSQTLVRDVVSGAFFLMDDAFRLGEYIEAGDSKGTVEKITIRTLHIRHHRGALNIVPYGEIKRLRNTSRDWMIMTMQFGLAYDTDLMKVKKIIKKIGEELAADPELGPELLQPLKSQGVTATDDAGLVVRVKFMAKPGSAPYLVRREAYSRILKAFAAQGIKFATRQVVVQAVPGTPPAAAAGAASVLADGGNDRAPVPGG